MTALQNSHNKGDPLGPPKSRIQLIQELKAARREKVRLHRAPNREGVTPRSLGPSDSLGTAPAHFPLARLAWVQMGEGWPIKNEGGHALGWPEQV